MFCPDSFQNPQKILVVRRDNIGDLVCTTPAFSALRRHFPNATICALVNSYNFEVLRGNPNIDQIFVYQKLKHVVGWISWHNALIKRIKLIFQLRTFNPDVTILAKSCYDRHGLNFARQFGAKNIIGFVPLDVSAIKKLPDIPISPPNSDFLHEVEVLNKLLASIGINDALEALQVFPDPELVTTLNLKLPFATTRIAFHISARESDRRWDNDNFIALAKHILEKNSGNQILLFWSPGEINNPHHPGDDKTAEKIIKEIKSDRLVPIPTRNLRELITGLSVCDLFIGSDGGALHLAAALNKKIIAMFENNPTKLKHWYPWKTPNRVLHSPASEFPAVRHIPLGLVIAAYEDNF